MNLEAGPRFAKIWTEGIDNEIISEMGVLPCCEGRYREREKHLLVPKTKYKIIIIIS